MAGLSPAAPVLGSARAVLFAAAWLTGCSGSQVPSGLFGANAGPADASTPSTGTLVNAGGGTVLGSGGVDSGSSPPSPNADAAGTCVPGKTECSGNSVQVCGPNAEWSAPMSCGGGTCSDGVCTDACTQGATQCSDNGVQTCQAGTWSAAVACVNEACVNGACTGSCAPGSIQCSGTTPQTCSSTGTWQDGLACPYVCSAGTCAGVCVPGKTQCSGSDVQVCGPDGQWGTPASCASGTCTSGSCAGTCTPGATQCSGNGVETCGTSGEWGTPEACVNQACVSGACTGSCAPGAAECVGSIPQICSTGGAWESGASCPYICSSGSCTGVCTAGTIQCSGSSIQPCESDDQWGTPLSDPIFGVEASTPDTLINYDDGSGPTGTGVAPDGETVTFESWTTPEGVSSLSVMYWLNSASSSIASVPLTFNVSLDAWSGTLPAQTAGTTVTWWVQGTDVCNTGTDYFSNAGNNYIYATQ